MNETVVDHQEVETARQEVLDAFLDLKALEADWRNGTLEAEERLDTALWWQRFAEDLPTDKLYRDRLRAVLETEYEYGGLVAG